MLRINETKRAMLPSIVKYLLPSDTAFLSFRSILEQRQKMNKTKESFSFKGCNLCPDDFMVAQRNSPGSAGGFAQEVFFRRSWRLCLGGFVSEVLPQSFYPRGFAPEVLPRRFCPGGFAAEMLPPRFCKENSCNVVLRG